MQKSLGEFCQNNVEKQCEVGKNAINILMYRSYSSTY